MLAHFVRKVWIGVLCLAATVGPTRADGKEEKKSGEPVVPYKGASLPTPPQQGKPWVPPPVKLSRGWVDAVRNLWQQGYADPRGCEYREVTLAFAGATHAWLIPRDPSNKVSGNRYAVTWDGMVYPVICIGPAASVKSDVEALLTEAAKHPSLNASGPSVFPVSVQVAARCGRSGRAASCAGPPVAPSRNSLPRIRCWDSRAVR